MRGLEVLTGFATAPGATLLGLTGGDTSSVGFFSIRSFNAPAKAYLLAVWADWQGATNNIFRLMSARMHDSQQGMRLRGVASEVYPLNAIGSPNELVSQDQISVAIAGSAVGGDLEVGSALVLYEDLPGVDAHLIGESELDERGMQCSSFEVSCVTSGGGGYTGSVALNSSFDVLKANTEYAVLGANVDTECTTIGIRGNDLGNLRVGIPGNDLNKILTNNWFLYLSKQYKSALMPVINSANKGAIFIDIATDENAGTKIVSLNLQELRRL